MQCIAEYVKFFVTFEETLRIVTAILESSWLHDTVNIAQNVLLMFTCSMFATADEC